MPAVAGIDERGTHPRIPFIADVRPDTRTNNVRLGMWLFIASEVMLFGGLFSAYVLLRTGGAHWGHEADFLSIGGGLGYAAILLIATLLLRSGNRRGLALAAVAGLVFLGLKAAGYTALIQQGVVPATSTFAALYYLLTAVHALHVLGGVLAFGHFAFHGTSATGGDQRRFDNVIQALRRYWYFVDLAWLLVFAAFYLL